MRKFSEKAHETVSLKVQHFDAHKHKLKSLWHCPYNFAFKYSIRYREFCTIPQITVKKRIMLLHNFFDAAFSLHIQYSLWRSNHTSYLRPNFYASCLSLDLIHFILNNLYKNFIKFTVILYSWVTILRGLSTRTSG